MARDLGYRILEVSGTGGRGMQLNIGADNASSEILLFLHADTLLPSDFSSRVQSCLDDPGNSLGAFSLKVDSGGFLLRCIVTFANLRSRLLSLPYGDQSLFMRRNDFFENWWFCGSTNYGGFYTGQSSKERGKIRTLPQNSYHIRQTLAATGPHPYHFC